MADTKTWDEVPVTSPTGAERVHVAPDANSDGHMTTQQIANLASGLPAARLAATAAGRVFGRASGAGAGAGQELTPTQTTALLDTFSRSAKGLAPASGGTSGTANFLREDGQWAAPPAGTGNVTSAAAPLNLTSGALTIATQDAASLPTAAFGDAADLVGLDAAGNPAQFTGTAMATWLAAQSNLLTISQVNAASGVLLDATVHNRRLIRATAAISISAPASLPNFGPGCSCFVLNDSSGNVTFGGTGMVGLTTLAPGAMAYLFSYSVPGGTPNQAIRVVAFGGGGATTSISIAAISDQVTGVPFTATGTLSGYSSAPTLRYSTDGSTYTTATGGTITSTAFSFSVPTIAAGSGRQVSVQDTTGITATAVSNTFNVTGPAISITALGSTPLVASGNSTVSVTFAGTLTGFVSAPASLQYSLDGGAWTAVSGATITASAFSGFTLALSAGARTLAVRDNNQSPAITSTTYSFNVGAVSISGVPTSGWAVSSLKALTGATATFTGITDAFAVLWDGSAEVGSRQTFNASTFATRSFTPATANSTHRIRVYSASSGGTLLAETATFTVDAAPALVLTPGLALNASGSRGTVGPWTVDVSTPVTTPVGSTYAANTNWAVNLAVWPTTGPYNTSTRPASGTIKYGWRTTATGTAATATVAANTNLSGPSGDATLATFGLPSGGDRWSWGFTGGPNSSSQGGTVGSQWYQVITIGGTDTFYVGPFTVV